jgi:FtsH-binding integral membrane protein
MRNESEANPLPSRLSDQSKYDFEGLAPWLFSGLMVLMTTSLVGIFFPFGQTTDLILACGGYVFDHLLSAVLLFCLGKTLIIFSFANCHRCLIFSGYILYDTNQIMKKLSPDEAIMVSFPFLLSSLLDGWEWCTDQDAFFFFLQGALRLYLDAINLFLQILRVVRSRKYLLQALSTRADTFPASYSALQLSNSERD